jgi:hypothetical protein
MSIRYALVVCLLICNSARAQRQFKNQAEFDLYNDVSQDLASNNFAKALADLDTWRQKFPESGYQDDRTALTTQALAGANQPAKAVDDAAELIGRDLSSALSGPALALRFLYSVATAIQRVADPVAAELATAQIAAEKLRDFQSPPPGVNAGQWTQARADIESVAKAALLYVALVPSVQALNRKDCETAQAAALHAQQQFPESAQAAWSLGSALVCQQKAHPEFAPLAIYQFARAAALDPRNAMVDPKWQQNTVEPYLQRVYVQFHGEDPEGLAQLKSLASGSPQPPAGFVLKSARQIELDRQRLFEEQHPQLALWLRIKGALSDPNGAQYFESELKGSAVPKLSGVIVEGKPACRPKELMIALRTADPKLPAAEILLKLDKPLPGKLGGSPEVEWEGVPSSFSASPFLLTMDVETAKLEGLKTLPCVPGKR